MFDDPAQGIYLKTPENNDVRRVRPWHIWIQICPSPRSNLENINTGALNDGDDLDDFDCIGGGEAGWEADPPPQASPHQDGRGEGGAQEQDERKGDILFCFYL